MNILLSKLFKLSNYMINSFMIPLKDLQ